MRVGIALTFLGHGFFAFRLNEKWIPYLQTVGLSRQHAIELMPLIGVLDISIGVWMLVKLKKNVVLWAAIWAFATAAIRPISGESIFSFVERGSNWVLPLALYFIVSMNGSTQRERTKKIKLKR